MCKENKFRVVSPAILEQIMLARDALNDKPGFDFATQHRVYHFLRCEANKHSVAFEMPNGHKVKRGKAREIAEANLKAAQDFFVRNYGGELSQDLVMDMAYMIEPDVVKLRAYRQGGITRSDSGHVYPGDVPREMGEFLAENKRLTNDVGKAVHSHFHIARIHPFQDGNGRLARLVQNCILAHDNLPPIVIEVNDRKEYINLLAEAARSYRENRELKTEQATFYNYLAMKLANSLARVSKRLSK